jgi:hypothetical protein
MAAFPLIGNWICQGADPVRAIQNIWDIIREDRQVGFGTGERIALSASARSANASRRDITLNVLRLRLCHENIR